MPGVLGDPAGIRLQHEELDGYEFVDPGEDEATDDQPEAGPEPRMASRNPGGCPVTLRVRGMVLP